jgi:ankyrin repeat protein
MRNHLKIFVYLFIAIAFSSARADALVDFFRAVHLDDERTVSKLLAQGFDPNSVNEKGQCGLFVAMRDEAPKVAAVLMAHPQIRIDQTNSSNETPLMMAALRGYVPLAEQLLARGAAVNRAGWTPLHYAASGPEPRMVALLLARGAVVDALSPNRSTPLMMASRYGPEESVDQLLAKGASLQARNDAGLGAADFAKLAAREPLARRLEQAAR